MNRTYDTYFFAEIIKRLRARLPDAAICLDVITGFPGETDDEFNNTYAFLENLPITDLHVFPYSKRPGTPAAEMTEQVPGDISKGRAEKLRFLAATKHAEFAQGFIGSELEVIVENTSRENMLKGISGNYLDVRFSGPLTLAGQCVHLEPVSWKEGFLLAERVKE
jgi:threonylcarbamoyladenosine tRNA methylthiotransferase MtaB